MSMLANFQSNRMIGTVFIGIERSMMAFCGKKNHLGFFFRASNISQRIASRFAAVHDLD
jgi:hypothetical protein